MRRVKTEELETDFERECAWGDDERHYYNTNRRKASVFSYFLRLNAVLDKITHYVQPGGRIGDFASAQGNFALLLAEKGYDVTAIDLHPDFLRYATKKHTHGDFKTIQANIIDYQSPKLFDAVLMGEIIEHVAYPQKLLQSAFNNLNPGGILILTTPNGGEYGQALPTFSQVTDLSQLIPRQFHWGEHLFLYTDQELTKLLTEQGFEVLEIQKMNSCYISQLKAVRYLLPYRVLTWLEKKTRKLSKGKKDSTNSLLVVAQKKRFEFTNGLR